ncbi:hypothetical protein BLNAU_2322 [Blattamonas nauphoetae]|uniref:Uncharacterized protein n=1 Tax=Blattamonas nauphoetae TaxID=2049346 RepID=A0ABQ9YGK5_9EUKA|nr:hypothetical protein BLNAU_2322 [Blattamonas nauphoetae]
MSIHPQIILTELTPLLASAVDEMSIRFSLHKLTRYLSTSPDLTTYEDKDSSAKTDLAFDILFMSLLSIVSDDLGSGRPKADKLSFADGVWMLLGRRETEDERDEDTNEVSKDEKKEAETESEEG